MEHGSELISDRFLALILGQEGGGLIVGFLDFRARSSRNGAILENFEDFFENFTKLLYSKCTKIAFQ